MSEHGGHGGHARAVPAGGDSPGAGSPGAGVPSRLQYVTARFARLTREALRIS